MYRYTAYGLDIASELELPELVAAADSFDAADADVRIRLGETPETLDAPAESRVVWSARPGEWLHTVPGIARYYIHDEGREVVIERRGGTDVDLRAFFFGTTLGALLHQRGLFALHASAVAIPGAGAVAIAGTSGSGKSTVLTALVRRGHNVLSEDKTVVRFADDGPEVLSGHPTLCLWRDAVMRIGEDPDALPPLREGMEKFLYRAPTFQHEPAPLRSIVVLNAKADGSGEVKTEVEVSEITAHQAIRTVLRQTYRRLVVNGLGFQGQHFQWSARLADTVPIIKVVRLRHIETVDEIADAVEAAARSTAEAEV